MARRLGPGGAAEGRVARLRQASFSLSLAESRGEVSSAQVALQQAAEALEAAAMREQRERESERAAPARLSWRSASKGSTL